MALKENLDSKQVVMAWNCLSGLRRQANFIKDSLEYLAADGVDVAYIQSELNELIIAAKVQNSILEMEKSKC